MVARFMDEPHGVIARCTEDACMVYRGCMQGESRKIEWLLGTQRGPVEGLLGHRGV